MIIARSVILQGLNDGQNFLTDPFQLEDTILPGMYQM